MIGIIIICNLLFQVIMVSAFGVAPIKAAHTFIDTTIGVFTLALAQFFDRRWG